ncbi:MAG: ABC transporter ATP-binding protein [Anaerolineae bacterium]|nr:ABC transporter ATP-binding protein [Anaerolineae bacterium]
MTIIQADGLSIEYRLNNQWVNVIHDVSLKIDPLQIHGLVGESGSGKSTLALAMMGYMAQNARISAGVLTFNDENLHQLSAQRLRDIWGRDIHLVPQDTLSALNPAYQIGEQMAEITRRHQQHSRRSAWEHAITQLERVKIPDAREVARKYPHQLSGGMRQRVAIAMALSTQPQFLVLDEPTTSLDVTTQAVILDEFRHLILENQSAALYVSHDLGTVAQFCDVVTVLYGGEVMESAPVSELYAHPIHPYTAGLLMSLPRPMEGSDTRIPTIDGIAPSLIERPKGCVFAPRCPLAISQCHAEKPPLETMTDSHQIRCWRWRDIVSGDAEAKPKPIAYNTPAHPRTSNVLKVTGMKKYFGRRSLWDMVTRKAYRPTRALDGVNLDIQERSTFGIVGESGSGKSTLARCIMGLEMPDSGEIELCAMNISTNLKNRPKEALRRLRMVFQNPDESLNPYKTVGQAINRNLLLLGELKTRAEREERIHALLKAVRLTPEYATRYPSQLSGGEKQRVAIARAFAAEPSLIVADEPTSSLDVSVQAVILNLLKDLRAERGVSYLLISHNLDVVAYLADWIAVMYLGQIVEEGRVDAVYKAPSHPYTEALVSANPSTDPTIQKSAIRLDGDIPSPRDIPTGCRFHTRCPRKIGAICETHEPPWQDAGDGHFIRCHIGVDELTRLQKG